MRKNASADRIHNIGKSEKAESKIAKQDPRRGKPSGQGAEAKKENRHAGRMLATKKKWGGGEVQANNQRLKKGRRPLTPSSEPRGTPKEGTVPKARSGSMNSVGER